MRNILYSLLLIAGLAIAVTTEGWTPSIGLAMMIYGLTRLVAANTDWFDRYGEMSH